MTLAVTATATPQTLLSGFAKCLATVTGGTPPYTYSWSVLYKPSGSTADGTDFFNPNQPSPTFQPDIVGEYGLGCLVTDSLAATASGGCTTTFVSSIAALTTLARVRRLPSMINIVDDQLVLDSLAAVSDACRKWCNRDFNFVGNEDEYHDGDGSDEIISKHSPIVSINSISYIPIGSNSTPIPLVLTDMTWDPNIGVIRFHHRDYLSTISRFPRGVRNIIMNYDYGFVTIPDAVQQGVALWTAEVCLKSQRDPSLASETIGKNSWRITEQSETNPLEPPPAARIFLARYRDLRI